MQFYFMRHGKTDKNPNDLERSLTDEGISQVIFKSYQLPEFDLAICSNTKRAEQTAERFCKEIRCLDILYIPPGEFGKNLMKMFLEFGRAAPLAKYLEEGNLVAMLKHGTEAWRQIYNLTVSELANNQGIKNVLVVGHDLLLNLIIFSAAVSLGGLSEESIAQIMKTSLEECEGFKVTLTFDARFCSFEKF